MSSSKTSQFFSGISIQTIITLVMGVMELVVFAIISRLLTKAEFGYYAAISGIIAIFLSISEAGLGSSIIQKKDASKDFISTAFSWSVILGTSISILVFALAPFLAITIADSTLIVPLRIMAITVLFNSLISVGNGMLYRKLAFKTAGIIGVVSYFVASIVSVIMAAKGMGLMAVVALPVVNAFIHVGLLFIITKYPKFHIRKNETKEIVSYGGWLTLGVVFNNVTHQLDKILLPKWMSVTTLGAYNRPAGFVSTISTKINGIFDTVLFPILSDLQNEKEKIQDVFLLATSLLNTFSVILASIFFFNAHLIISVFFGTQWMDMVPVMQIISISVIFNINGRLVDCFFRSLAFVKLGFFLRVLSAIVMFSCIYVGSHYGVNGVAASIVVANITNIFIKVICLAYKTNTSKVKILQSFFFAWKPVLPLLLIGTPFLLLDYHSWVINICFAIVFAIVVIVEFVFFPKFIGKAYVQRAYPMVEKIKNKIIKR